MELWTKLRVTILFIEGLPPYLYSTLSLQVALKEYLSRGKDGYTVFLKCPRLCGGEDGPILDTLILNHFLEVER